MLRQGTGLSRRDYLINLVFPDSAERPGPSVRTGDFTEILISDYLEFILGYNVPRIKFAGKAVRNEPVKGVDVVGFTQVDQKNSGPGDTLITFEVKAKLTGRSYDDTLQKAINDPSKDYLRLAETLNAIKRKYYAEGKNESALQIERFQNKPDNPYIYKSGAAVAELILHKVYSHNSTDDVNYKQTKVDLIIWPELAVNDDDIDILKSLADKTGAMIFTGIAFKSQNGIKGPNNLAKWIIPSKHSTGLQYITRYQGKQYLTADEIKHAHPWRPYQLLIELVHPVFPNDRGFILTGSICYDATDIKISADLKDKANAYLIPSLNKDVSTFDSMVDALYYHMYQHVVLVNTGEFGGSVAKAPYAKRYDKLITHVHGVNQVSISTFEMNMFDFRSIGKSLRSGKELKTRPAC